MSKEESVTVTLDFPFEWDGDRKVETIEIPRPKAFHMRGLNVKKLETDTDEMFKLLQKLIGEPPRFLDKIDFADITKMMGVVEGFLSSGPASASEEATKTSGKTA